MISKFGVQQSAIAVVLAAIFSIGIMGKATAASDELIKKGQYMVWAGGCIGCHTDVKGKKPELAGGLGLKTPFGVFYSPNITPDKETGIGNWTDEDFVKAFRQGLSPDNDHYYPVFPYPTYTKMRDADILAIKAYLFSLKPVRNVVEDHNVQPPFGMRILQGFWKAMNFTPGEFQDVPDKSPEWNRGAYLVEAVGHCGECHTPRSDLSALDHSMSLAGTLKGPDGGLVPNITPHPKTGIGDWDEDEIIELLKNGVKPDYDDVQGGMEEAVNFGLKYLTDADLKAMAVYLLSLEPIDNLIEKPKK
jgi:mono/diheme cytochrome c family protein